MHTILSDIKRPRSVLRRAAALLIAFGIFAAAPAFAATQQPASSQDTYTGRPAGAPGGYTGPGIGASAVGDVRSMRDDTPVVLRGRIVRSLGDERYLFQDTTGTVTVEIDREVWQGQSIGPEDTVEIEGEVDRDLFSVEVDVDRISRQ